MVTRQPDVHKPVDISEPSPRESVCGPFAAAEEGGPPEFEITLPGELWSVGLARILTASALERWGLDGFIDDGTVVISELVTNALAAAPGAAIRVRLRRNGGETLLEVWDPADEVPEWHHPGDDDEHGRGLPLVSLLAADWGITIEPQGKSVWAKLARVRSVDGFSVGSARQG